jgi:hypothetical protein
MARKRFSDLERISDALRLGKVDPTTLPQNLDFVKYEKWKRGEAVRATPIVRPPLNGEVEVGITAFGLPAANPGSKKLVTLSGRAKSNVDGLSGLGAKLYVTPTADHFKDGSFVPAKIRVVTIVSSKSPTSNITGRKYKTRSGSAYTAPFGQMGANDYYQEAVAALLAGAPFAGATPTHMASFSPEQWRRD